MFVLRAYQLNNEPVPSEKWEFPHLPIRIGRHPLNDFAPQNSMVSSYHARIEEIDGKICIRDLGSKNGVYVAGPEGSIPQRVEPDATADLAPGGFRFFLSARVVVQMEIVSEEAPPRSSPLRLSVLGNLAMMAPGSAARAPAEPSPWGQSGVAGSASGYPTGPTNPPPPLPPAAPDRPSWQASPAGPAQWGPSAPGGGYPAAPSHPPPGGFLPVPGSPLPPAAGDPARTQAFNVELDTLALQGLRELTESLIPGRPLATTGEVARLITKLHDTIDVFCRSFIPLRDGYAQFVSSLDLQRSAAQRTMHRSRSAIALETAASPEAVAMALLDPNDQSFDAPQAVEGIFADLMLHQLALLDGVMQGVRSLLDELSPGNIEAALAQRGTAGLFKSKDHARWSEFCDRFERLSDERQTFAVIFGRSFAEVYRQYWRRKDGEDRGLPTIPPGR